jgi:hypothetical protein
MYLQKKYLWRSPKYQDMKILAIIAVAYFDLLYFMTRPAIGGNGSVTVAWDDNTESDLAGYKIYVGKTSRFATEFEYQAVSNF